METYVRNEDWYGVNSIVLGGFGYEGRIIPSIGANLIELNQVEKDIKILRMVEDLETYQQRPGTYGIPILFPPNRIDGGQFTYEGTKYQFPINESRNNNSLHGFLHERAWDVDSMVANEEKSEVVLKFNGTTETDFYKFFPHEFQAVLVYKIDKEGLFQELTIKNLGEKKMPVGIGYHTAFNLKLSNSDNDRNAKVLMSVDQKILLNERMLPTGEVVGLSSIEEEYINKGVDPLYTALDDHFTAKPFMYEGKSFNGSVIENKALDLKVVYEVGPSYKHWMIWNCKADGDFVCLEPQNWRINTPNLNIGKEESGLIELSSGEAWTDYTKIYLD